MPAERIATVRSGDVELAVFEWGPTSDESAGHPADDRPTLLLVHGFPDTHSVWNPLAERLAKSARVLAYDVRGAGASTGPTARRDYRIDALVEDQLAVLRTVSPDRKVHLVAHDWGSIQSWYTVTDQRGADHIASYTSVSGPCLDHVAMWMRGSVRSPRRWAQATGQLGRSWYVWLMHVPGVARGTLRWVFGKILTRTVSAAERAEPGPTGADEQWPAPTLVDDGQRGIQLYRANFFPRLLRPQERRTDIPVQLIVPTKDRYVSPAIFQDMDRWVSQLRRHDIPAGHWVIRSEPDQVAGWISELVEEIEQGGPIEASEQSGQNEPVEAGEEMS